jgi:hypothetical protein
MAPPSSRSQWRRRQLPTNRCDREATVQRPRPPALLWQPPACSSSSSLGFTSPRLPLQPLRLPPQCRPSTSQRQRRRCPRMRPSPGRRPRRPRRRSTSRQQRPLCTSRRLLAPARVQPTSPPLGPPRWPAARCPPPLLCRSKARAACPLAQEVVLPDVRAHHLLPARASHHLACPALWTWIQWLHSERLIACMHVPPCLVMMRHNPAFFTGWLTSLPHWPARCVCLPAYLQLGPPPRPSRRRPRRLPARQRTFPWTKQVGSRTPGSGSPPVTSTPACPLPVVPWLVCSAVLVCLRCITLPPTPPSCPADTFGVRAEYQPVVATIRGLFEVGAKLGGPCSTHSPPGLCKRRQLWRCCCCGLLSAHLTACVPPVPPRLAEQLYQREVGAHPSKAREVHVNSCKLGILFWKLNKGGWQLQRVGGRAGGWARAVDGCDLCCKRAWRMVGGGQPLGAHLLTLESCSAFPFPPCRRGQHGRVRQAVAAVHGSKHAGRYKL